MVSLQSMFNNIRTNDNTNTTRTDNSVPGRWWLADEQ
jgi:hypothetical protein